jgi:RND family efflux transporter MFP subunit
VEQVMVDFTGREVLAGEPMLTIYSPELVASQQEYLLALRAKDVLEHSSVPGITHSNEALVAAARRRLEHWGMEAPAIAQLTKTQEPQRTFVVRAPAGGFVTTRNAFPNQKVTGETELYTLTDQSRVWILADVFESDDAAIRMGQAGTVSIEYLPNRKLRATVTNILPQVDPQTRTLKVRLEADNPAGALKPDQFVTVEFTSGAGAKLTVAADAVLDSGRRQVVFVDRGGGLFEKRLVQTGERFDERVEVVSGLREGERVVVSGAFLLDSESQLKSPGAAAAAPSPGAAPKKPDPGGHAGHKHD